jgi:tetratricopeptide (TPR) repeat protein
MPCAPPREFTRSQLARQINGRSKFGVALTVLVAFLFFGAASASAIDIPGVVKSSTRQYATVLTESDSLPAPGDKAEIYFKLPGSDIEISVATGHVYEITGPNIMVQIDNATGSVAKNQLVRINSPHPKKRSEVAAQPPPPKPGASANHPSPSQTPAPPSSPKMNTPAPRQEEIDPAAGQYLNKGIAAYSAGDIDGAIAAYTSGIRIAPNLAVLYLNRANAYLFKPDFGAAIADANKALELKVEKMDDAYVIRAAANAGQANYDAAIADCNRALNINPKHALAYNNRANDKLRKGDYAGALADCNKSIALDSSAALPYYNRGYVYMNLGQASNAIADWNKAMQMQPGFRSELQPLVQRLSGSSRATGAAVAQTPHTPQPGSAQRQAICDAARTYVVAKYASGPLPQPIVFKIEHLLVKDRFCNMEAVALFKDGSNAAPTYLPDVVFNLCLKRTEHEWRVVADLSRSDVPTQTEIAQIRARLSTDFPFSVLSPTWRKLLNGENQ